MIFNLPALQCGLDGVVKEMHWFGTDRADPT